MAKNMLMKKFQTLDNRQYLQNALQSKSPINESMSSPVDLSDNRRNQIIEVLPKKDKTDKSVKTRKVEKTDTNEEKSSKRNPKCSKCANHILKPVPVKGHKRKCKYRECRCNLCELTVQRRIISAKTIYEKRKLKDDRDDDNFNYPKPVFKRQASDDCLSETDKESDYSTNTEDNLKSKPIDLQKSFDQIWNIFARMHSDESTEDVGKHVLKFINENIKQKTEPKKTIESKRKVSKQESSDQTSSVKSEDSNDLLISSLLTPQKTPISSPTTSSTHSVESLLGNNCPIRPPPHPLYHSHPHYNFMNNLNFDPFKYTPHMINILNNSLTTTPQIYRSFGQSVLISD